MISDKGRIQVSGGSVYFEIHGNKNTKPLVVLHGGPGAPHYSLLPIKKLSDERNVIFYDQLGCGKSSRPNNTNLWKKERFVEELNEVIKYLKIDNFHLYGHSWGSMLAVMFALKYPRGINSIIMSGPFLSVPRWEQDAAFLIKHLPKKYKNSIYNAIKNNDFDSKEYKQAEKQFYVRHLCRVRKPASIQKKMDDEYGTQVYNTMWGPSEFICKGNLKDFDLTSRLHELSIPVLLTCGKYDEALPSTVKQYHSLIKGSKLRVFSKCSHSPFWEEQESFLNNLRLFLQKY